MEEKPPTQGVGVQGFNAFATPADEPPPTNWNALVQLPAFGMFIAERPRFRGEVNPSTIGDYLKSIEHKREFDVLYTDYCKWHAEKGYWPNETPMGELIE